MSLHLTTKIFTDGQIEAAGCARSVAMRYNTYAADYRSTLERVKKKKQLGGHLVRSSFAISEPERSNRQPLDALAVAVALPQVTPPWQGGPARCRHIPRHLRGVTVPEQESRLPGEDPCRCCGTGDVTQYLGGPCEARLGRIAGAQAPLHAQPWQWTWQWGRGETTHGCRSIKRPQSPHTYDAPENMQLHNNKRNICYFSPFHRAGTFIYGILLQLNISRDRRLLLLLSRLSVIKKKIHICTQQNFYLVWVITGVNVNVSINIQFTK